MYFTVTEHWIWNKQHLYWQWQSDIVPSIFSPHQPVNIRANKTSLQALNNAIHSVRNLAWYFQEKTRLITSYWEVLRICNPLLTFILKKIFSFFFYLLYLNILPCSQCDKHFREKVYVQKHLQSVHKRFKHVLNKCDKEFSFKISLFSLQISSYTEGKSKDTYSIFSSSEKVNLSWRFKIIMDSNILIIKTWPWNFIKILRQSK